jgi:hypothetical protein
MPPSQYRCPNGQHRSIAVSQEKRPQADAGAGSNVISLTRESTTAGEQLREA